MPRGARPAGAGAPDLWSYRAPKAVARAELKEKGSRFLAWTSFAADEAGALGFVASLRRSYHDATHHCWAYRLGWGGGLRERSDDDGEPARTAGYAILSSLTKQKVSDAIVVVVRYFGGTKLGTAGLARAYRDASHLVLETADLETRTLTQELEFSMPYSAQGPFRHLLRRFGVDVAGESFGETWAGSMAVPLGKLPELEAALVQLGESYRGEIRWKSK